MYRLKMRVQGSGTEKVHTSVFERHDEMARVVAQRISNLILSKKAAGENTVLGLPTGSTPVSVYRELIRMHKEEGLDFTNVITFNLDEYFGLKPTQLQSYHRFMAENFFNEVNVPTRNIHILDGACERDKVETNCMNYEMLIKKSGGFDLTILGIGRTGHIAFNEPGSSANSQTRLAVLDSITRKDAASSFYGIQNVPFEALTMGVGTILESNEIILMATGENKAFTIRNAIEGNVGEHCPASFLQNHANSHFFLDKAAAAELTRMKTPWLVRDVEWDLHAAKKAVIHVATQLNNSIFDLMLDHFLEFHLHDLIHARGGPDKLCRCVFEDLNGKLSLESALPENQTILVFSPHPDDDVICMGGTLLKLVERGNNVCIAYMTNGSVSVFDVDLVRHLRFVLRFTELCKATGSLDIKKEADSIYEECLAFMKQRKPGEPDREDIQKMKANIRATEALAAIEMLGVDAEQASFLDLPFYQTGTAKKNPCTHKDVDIVKAELEKRKVDHIFVAGDLTDPHGTHRQCYFAIRDAMNIVYAEKDIRPQLWLYRGAWQEWATEDVDVFVALTRRELRRKILSIYKHESQTNKAMFPGQDRREFWERARDRNKETARSLYSLGLPRYHAIEAFLKVDHL